MNETLPPGFTCLDWAAHLRKRARHPEMPVRFTRAAVHWKLLGFALHDGVAVGRAAVLLLAAEEETRTVEELARDFESVPNAWERVVALEVDEEFMVPLSLSLGGDWEEPPTFRREEVFWIHLDVTQ